MKTTLLLISVAATALAQTKAPQPSPDPGWPREINRDGIRLVYYQPQVDEWRDYRSLRLRVAFSLTPKDGKGTVGVAELEGRTVANLEARTVAIQNLKITTARFPSVPEAEAAPLQAALQKAFPGKSLTVALDRLVAGVDRTKEGEKTVELKMDPPPIFTSTSDAVLLLVDGEPVRAPLDGTALEFVVNTNWNLFFDPAASAYYLLAGKTWMTGTALDGEWKLATKLPADFRKMPKDKSWDEVRKSVPAKVTKGMKIPRVIYSEQPAELIAFKGAPVFEKVDGTRLLWAKNTESWVFQDSQDQQTYFLVSGRWFRAPKLEGPWTYAGNDLPEDFKLIPPESPYADVLASVPGTPEAEDAVLLAQVPVEAEVQRADAEAKAKVSYGGEPKFAPIEGTAMTYATNTTADVIEVEKSYYLCQDAVWFVGTTPIGPWKISVTVPAVIYTIPARYPVHRVTYVKVESGDNDATVVCSYTAGYYGAFVAGVATRAALVYGTGWYYPPYVYRAAVPIYRPWGATYGCSAAYNPWTGGYVAGGAVYGPYGAAGRAAWYNPATGGYGRAASVQTGYGGRTVAAGYNPNSNTGWATRQGNNGYAQWGTSAVQRGDDWVRTGHVATEEGGVAGWRGSDGAGRVRVNDGNVSGVAVHDDNLYAGKDGNVYRRDDDGDWAKYDDGDWENVNKPDRKNSSSQSTNGKSQQKPPQQKPQNPPQGQRPGGADRPQNGERPSTLPAERQRPQGGERPSTMPVERNRPQNSDRAPIEQRPATRPARTQPSDDVMSGLNRESGSRSRSSQQVSRQQSFQRSGGGAEFGGSRNFERSGGGGGRGGGDRGGGGRGGGGGRRR